jgi:endoglucanase
MITIRTFGKYEETFSTENFYAELPLTTAEFRAKYEKDAQKVVETLKENQLYINIGATSKKEALSRVSLGDTGTLIGDFTPFGDGRLMARALDDRCGCAILISLLKSEAPVDFTAVFTVQEEIGCRGAMMASAEINPDVAIVLDSTTACDIQDVAPEKTVCNLKEGGVVSFMDRGCAYDRDFFSLIMKTAEENSIPAQVKRAVAGANDSASICKSTGGVKTAAISMPCRYLHTPNCVIDTRDMDSIYKLVLKVLEKVAVL